MDQDQEVQNMQNEHPEFSIKMKSSHVNKIFLLNLPAKFCKSYMPDKDKDVVLVDNEGQETTTKYLAKGHRLSGGWKRFATDHELSEDDILVFRRIATAPDRLKVDIYQKDVLVAAEGLAVLASAGVLAYW